MNAIETIKNDNYIAEIYIDENPFSPREDSNLGKMMCFLKPNSYKLGDKTDLKFTDFSGWDDLEEYIRNELKGLVVFSLFLYDHSGLRIKIGEFSQLSVYDRHFDSGQIGFIYADEDTIKKELGIKEINKDIIERVEKILMDEVELYDQYLSGDVYGFKIQKKNDKNEFVDFDSCWGFYGLDCIKDEINHIINN